MQIIREYFTVALRKYESCFVLATPRQCEILSLNTDNKDAWSRLKKKLGFNTNTHGCYPMLSSKYLVLRGSYRQY